MAINPIVKFANTSCAKKYMNWAVKERTIGPNNSQTKRSNYEWLQKNCPTVFLTTFFAVQSYFLYKSKDMKKERKYPLILNNLFSCSLALITGALLGKHINKLTNKMVERAKIIYKDPSEKSDLVDGIKTGVPFLIGVMLFEYIGPVIATPLSIKATSLLEKKGLINLNETSKNNPGVDNRKVN